MTNGGTILEVPDEEEILTQHFLVLDKCIFPEVVVIRLLILALAILTCVEQYSYANPQELPEFEPTWYVSNTEKNEWIRFQEIHLTRGNYRFTANLGATVEGAKVELLIRNNKNDKVARMGVVEVPKQPTRDHFQLVHLGKGKFTTGSYDIALRFLDKGISTDFVYIRKSVNKQDEVIPDDVAHPAPYNKGMTRITPIGPYSTPSKRFKFLEYSPEQCMAWYRQSAHIGLDREDAIRSAIETAVSARLDWCWLHGRAAKSKPNWDWGIDREVVPNPGELPGHRLKPYFEVLEKVPYAEHLRYSYFCDNAHFGKFFSRHHDGKKAEWQDPEFQDFIWKNWLQPWYANIPRDRHMINENGRIFLYFWTVDCGVSGKDIYPFFLDLKRRLKSEFDLEVDFLLPGKFAKRDPRVAQVTYAQPPWFYWNMEQNVTFQEFKGRTLAFATNGRKLPISCVWDTDWDPVSGKGTRTHVDQYPEDAHFRSTHSNGQADYELGLIEANKRRAKWMLLESWGNTFEGSTWFRSDHPEYKFPNEFINITRKYSDRKTTAIMLQAECYDAAHDKSTGNDGKAYRYNWHTTGEPDVDIFRPLHQIENFRKSDVQKKLIGIAAGVHDVWAVNEKGKPFANEVDGNAKWKPAKSNGLAFDRLALGKGRGWCVSGGKLHFAALPRGWNYFNTGKWSEVKTPTDVREIAFTPESDRLLYIDAKSSLWRGKPIPGDDSEVRYKFEKVESEPLISIGRGRDYMWALNKEQTLLRRDLDLDGPWQEYQTKLKFTSLSVGSNELWAVTRDGQVYRMPDVGGPRMEFVMKNVAAVSVGSGFVWLVKQDGTVWWSRLSGFASTKMKNSIAVKSK